MAPGSSIKGITARLFLAALGVLALVLAALFWGLTQRVEARAARLVVVPADVSIVDFAFQPQVIRVPVGGSVKWTNNGMFTHTSTSDTLIWDSKDITPGMSFTQVFNTPGIFPYHCMHHTFMTGFVVVGIQTYLPMLSNSH